MPLPRRVTSPGRRAHRLRATLLPALACIATLPACGSSEPEPGDATPSTAPAAAVTTATGDVPVRPPTPQQAERLRVALATNIDPSLSRRYERVAPLAVRGCRTMRMDLSGERWDATVRADFRAAGFADFTLRDASLFLEILRSDYCPIAG